MTSDTGNNFQKFSDKTIHLQKAVSSRKRTYCERIHLKKGAVCQIAPRSALGFWRTKKLQLGKSWISFISLWFLKISLKWDMNCFDYHIMFIYLQYWFFIPQIQSAKIVVKICTISTISPFQSQFQPTWGFLWNRNFSGQWSWCLFRSPGMDEEKFVGINGGSRAVKLETEKRWIPGPQNGLWIFRSAFCFWNRFDLFCWNLQNGIENWIGDVGNSEDNQLVYENQNFLSQENVWIIWIEIWSFTPPKAAVKPEGFVFQQVFYTVLMISFQRISPWNISQIFFCCCKTLEIHDWLGHIIYAVFLHM